MSDALCTLSQKNPSSAEKSSLSDRQIRLHPSSWEEIFEKGFDYSIMKKYISKCTHTNLKQVIIINFRERLDSAESKVIFVIIRYVTIYFILGFKKIFSRVGRFKAETLFIIKQTQISSWCS